MKVFMKTQVYLRGANCPVCLETVRDLLLADSRVEAVHSSFSDQCLEVEHADMPNDDLVRVLQQNLHGIEIGSNGETGMAEIVPQVGKWHCHATGA
jgi:hypothetical protein